MMEEVIVSLNFHLYHHIDEGDKLHLYLERPMKFGNLPTVGSSIHCTLLSSEHWKETYVVENVVHILNVKFYSEYRTYVHTKPKRVGFLSLLSHYTEIKDDEDEMLVNFIDIFKKDGWSISKEEL